MDKMMANGLRLDHDFAGHPVYLFTHEGNYYIECKKVVFLYDDYLLYLKDKTKDILGYNLKGVPCRIRQTEDITIIGCLKDTTEKFNSIIINVKKIIRHDKTK